MAAEEPRGANRARELIHLRVGGIEAQIVSGDSGILIDDPHDLAALGDAVVGLLEDPQAAAEMGQRAQKSVSDKFLPDRHLEQWANLVLRLLRTDPHTPQHLTPKTQAPQAK